MALPASGGGDERARRRAGRLFVAGDPGRRVHVCRGLRPASRKEGRGRDQHLLLRRSGRWKAALERHDPDGHHGPQPRFQSGRRARHARVRSLGRRQTDPTASLVHRLQFRTRARGRGRGRGIPARTWASSGFLEGRLDALGEAGGSRGLRTDAPGWRPVRAAGAAGRGRDDRPRRIRRHAAAPAPIHPDLRRARPGEWTGAVGEGVSQRGPSGSADPRPDLPRLLGRAPLQPGPPRRRDALDVSRRLRRLGTDAHGLEGASDPGIQAAPGRDRGSGQGA